MANTNCLQGLRCPQCGSYEPFHIEVLTVVQMWDDGTESDLGGGLDWKEDSYIDCYACQHSGTVKDFTLTTQETPNG